MSATQKAGVGRPHTHGWAKVVIGIVIASSLASLVVASMVSTGDRDEAAGAAVVLSQPLAVPGIRGSDGYSLARAGQFEESERIRFPSSEGSSVDRVRQFEESERIRFPSSDGTNRDG